MKRGHVFGAAGAVGEAAAHALVARGWQVTASVHTQREDAISRLRASGAAIRYDNLEHGEEWLALAAASDALIFAVPLPLAAAALARCEPAAKRIVVLSDNAIAIQPATPASREMLSLEAELRANWSGAIILRPTLIYGDPRLSTVTGLMRRAQHWPFLPMPGDGRALVQPIFYEDVGRAMAWMADAGEAGAYAIGGPDAVKMRSFFRAVARAVESKAPIVPVPSALVSLAAPLLSLEQALRADRDLLVVQQTPLPRDAAARVGLKEGLARLALASR